MSQFGPRIERRVNALLVTLQSQNVLHERQYRHTIIRLIDFENNPPILIQGYFTRMGEI